MVKFHLAAPPIVAASSVSCRPEKRYAIRPFVSACSFIAQSSLEQTSLAQPILVWMTTPRNRCPLFLARALLGNAAMLEDSQQSTPAKDRPNGQSSVRLVRQIKHADDQLVTLVSQNPLAAMALAIAVGYVLGRAISRHG
jgi:hypothetical protein